MSCVGRLSLERAGSDGDSGQYRVKSSATEHMAAPETGVVVFTMAQ